jgi:hypothetical protein
MLPVMQGETAPGRGNCLAACVASILECPLADVPNFALERDCWSALQTWLVRQGLMAIRLTMPEASFPLPRTFCILTGDSPRRPVYHAVVGEWEQCAWRIVHDPHPQGGGLAGPPKWVTFFAMQSPERYLPLACRSM